MKGRQPRADELSLWNRVNEKTDVFERQRGLPDPAPKKRAEPKARPTFPTSVRSGTAGRPSTQVQRAPSLAEEFAAAPPVMDRKLFTKLRRGTLKPEGKIDLHGMTVDRAHLALSRFILSAHVSGKRLVLVVTGKGKARDDGGPIPVRLGVLRHQVPQWLSLPPLSGAVMQVTPAHQRHGGTGAYYVYLRRAR